jgi:hypothetical protein
LHQLERSHQAVVVVLADRYFHGQIAVGDLFHVLRGVVRLAAELPQDYHAHAQHQYGHQRQQDAADDQENRCLPPETGFDVVDVETGARHPAPRLELHHAVHFRELFVRYIRLGGVNAHERLVVRAARQRIAIGLRRGFSVRHPAAVVGRAHSRGDGVVDEPVVGERTDEEIVAVLPLRADGFHRACLGDLAVHVAVEFQGVEITELGVGEVE